MGVGRSIIVACLNSNRSLASWQSIGESRFEWSARSPINCDADRRLREGLARRSRAKDARIAMSARWRPAAGRSTSLCARTTFHRRPKAAGSIVRAQNWRASRFRVNAMASRPQTQTTRSQIVSPRIETHRGPSPPLNCRSFTSYSTQASEILHLRFCFGVARAGEASRSNFFCRDMRMAIPWRVRLSPRRVPNALPKCCESFAPSICTRENQGQTVS